jgi:hypothetical protein
MSSKQEDRDRGPHGDERTDARAVGIRREEIVSILWQAGGKEKIPEKYVGSKQ